MRTPLPWDEVFIRMAEVIALRSKDPNTQVGSIAVSPDKKRIATGFNGMISGYPENDMLWERPTKYLHVIHAETNLIINAKTDLSGWTLYLTMPCCSDCAKHVAQAGIKRVVYKNEPNPSSKLNYELAFDILRTAGVVVEKLEALSGGG